MANYFVNKLCSIIIIIIQIWFVLKVFLKMDSSKSGSVSMNEMQKYFSPLAHPDVIAKKKTVEELMHNLFGCLQPPTGGSRELRGYITYAVSLIIVQCSFLTLIITVFCTGF